jgi:hypothetical protein
LSLLDDVLDRLKALPPDERQSVIDTAMEQTKAMRFVPLPGRRRKPICRRPMSCSTAGKLAAGKSYLLMGLASQEHTRSIIFRRESSQTDGLEEAGKQIIGESPSSTAPKRNGLGPACAR